GGGKGGGGKGGGEEGWRNSTTGGAGCCARAARGHATAAPPSAASNSRRPMVTVIRPSRARCVNGRIPRHERAVPTARHPARTGCTPGTGWNGAPPGPRVRLDFKRFIFGRAASLPLGSYGTERLLLYDAIWPKMRAHSCRINFLA